MAAPPAVPQDQETIEFPILSLEIEGNENYTDEQVIRVSGLKVGVPANKRAFERAQQRLLEAGAFESVAFRYSPAASGDGYAAVIEVSEIQQVYSLRFIHIEATEEDLRAWLKEKEPLYAEKIPGTQELINQYAAALTDYLTEHGKPEEVQGELTMDGPDDMFILFHPAGALPVVAEVDFSGNKVIPAGTLREAIHGVAIGSRFTDNHFQELLDTSVRPLYDARGRVRVAFSNITSERADRDINGLKIHVEVNEGETYEFGNIDVEGTASLDRELGRLVELSSGDLANFQQVRAAVERLNQAMRSQGYMKVATRADRTINDEDKTVDLVFRVDPGHQYTFGKLFIEGLDVHGEHEIRRIWGVDPGAPYRADYPDLFLGRVREEGLFDNLKKTLSRVELDETAHVAHVTLIFNPKPQKTIPSTFDDPFKKKRPGQRR
ncbi:MAG: hypothetical protein GY953_19575 [bacterium]|nr:hypothetical protein [bacterium]